ncbi:uncharacterized protein L969DRAFT_84363 [Mixia osmundae IAM 14324]|uniref:Uncharacterized protein n=1 Tax=Mixia osmundae (strain CBS 9802 / IAM 14324 / JCM 22182 / KY 12970) TaxID=764103 RepID=G7E327_MIXOS|nr:uncharacterized protein L969DRAFT_84363 [Mixia osmundae IAM 14324]KEI42503.1 hypothetical protein L969DRAFT_84363 [Mixia osmundae IAM 14324]GAA97208.1 hypothetical protein E5Q_03884 [Mixia osmundae IAM 14324]
MFNDILDSIQASENVLGVCLLDENGVCLGTRGRLTTVSMDRSTDLPALILASALKPKADQRAPFAIVWDQHASMHISQNARLTLAVLKRAP